MVYAKKDDIEVMAQAMRDGVMKPQGRQFRVMFLEDDDNDALFIKRALERSGVSAVITRFPDPHAAIAALEGMKDPEEEAPDLIITDLKMPKMSGLDFVRWLRASRFSCVPVIMLSGSSLPEDILKAYRAGTNSFSTKPVETEELDRIATTVMQYWKEACHTPAAILTAGMRLCEADKG